jgi:hypothetical protein
MRAFVNFVANILMLALKAFLNIAGFCCCALAFGPSLAAQGGGNPFDLAPRLSAAPASERAAAPTDNPFDIVAAPRALERPSPGATAPQLDYPAQFGYVKLGALLIVLILLAALISLFRGLVLRSLSAVFNETVFNQLYRDRESRGGLPFYLLYGLFFLNAGLYVFFLLHHYEQRPPFSPLSLLTACVLGLSFLFLLKHLTLSFLAYLFPSAQNFRRYSFAIVVFGILLGLFLAAVNLVFALGAEKNHRYVAYVSLAIIAAIYLIRCLRGLSIGYKLLRLNKFHFLLYICTVEIAPVLFLVKLVDNYLVTT